MRCLTLAKELRELGNDIWFFSKPHDGHILEVLRCNHFLVEELIVTASQDSDLSHSEWLGGNQEDDVSQCISLIEQRIGSLVDWVIVDHYGIDARWESAIKEYTNNLLVIDDLADRKHECDILLDQTLGRSPEDYSSLVSRECELLLGTQYALLRDEFRKEKSEVINIRRSSAERYYKKLLVMMGGTDHLNRTSKVLESLLKCTQDERITVVLGHTAPHKDCVLDICSRYNRMALKVGVSNVADLMLEHDICFGAAGSASWERCALGMPSLLLAFADNQQLILKELADAGAALFLSSTPCSEEVSQALVNLSSPASYLEMATKCLKVCDGQGTYRVITRLLDDKN